MYLCFIFISYIITQFGIQSLFNNVKVSVLAENGWNKQPIVCCPYPTIRSVITIECTMYKLRHIRRRSLIIKFSIMIGRSSVFNVICTHTLSQQHVLLCFSYKGSVHYYITVFVDVFSKKFVLGSDRFL